MRRTKKILYWTLGIIVALILQAILLIRIFEDELILLAKNKLNEYLITEVKVEKIELSLLKHFPRASVEFTNSSIKEPLKGSSKNLLTAQRISMVLSLWDIYRQNYRIKKILIEGGILAISVDKNGKDNYHFWKSVKSSGNEKFTLQIDEITVKDVLVSYLDLKLQQNYLVNVKSSVIAGNFSASQFLMNTKADLFVEHLKSGKTTFINKKSLLANLKLDINTKDQIYGFNNAIFALNGVEITGKGIVKNEPGQTFLDLAFSGKDLTIQSFLALLPPTYTQDLKKYSSKGDFYFDTKIKGYLSDKKTPAISVNSGINKGEITVEAPEGKLVMKNVNVNASYNNGKNHSSASSVLQLKKFVAQLDGKPLQASLIYKNFDDPYIDLYVKGDINLRTFYPFIPGNIIKTMDGKLLVDASFTGYVRNFKEAESIGSTSAKGTIIVENTNFKLSNSLLDFKNFEGDFRFQNNALQLTGFKGNISSTDFLIDGNFKNLVAYILLPDQDIEIDASIRSKTLNLDELLAVKQTSNGEIYNFKINPKLVSTIRASVGKMNFKRFNAYNLTGVLQIKDQVMISDRISFNAMDGQLNSTLMINARDKDLMVDLQSSISSVNVKKMFYEFDNFGQQVLQDKNINGSLSANVSVSSVWNRQLEANLNELKVTSIVLLENGQMMDFEPLLALSKFVSIRELRNLKFETLQNNIEIKNNTIFIPKMEINNNAVNLLLSGSHNFSNKIDYKIRLLLADVIAKKSSRSNDSDFGEVSDDGSGKTYLFLKMYGQIDNPKFTLDKTGIKEKIAADIKAEKTELKETFGQDFKNIFSKQKTVIEKPLEGAKEWEKDIPGSRIAPKPKTTVLQPQQQSSPNTPIKNTTEPKKSAWQKLKEKAKENEKEEEF